MEKDRSSGVIHPVDVCVGKRIRERRQYLNVSQEKLAESVGITFQQIQKYEKGYNRVSSSKLFDIAQFLCTSIEYFFQGVDEYPDLINHSKSAAHETNEKYSFASDAEIAMCIKALKLIRDDKTRVGFINLIKSVAEFQNSETTV